MDEVGYRKTYSIRRAIPGTNSLEVTFPFDVVEQESRARGVTIEEFIKRFKVVAEYGPFPGVRYTFTEDGAEAA